MKTFIGIPVESLVSDRDFSMDGTVLHVNVKINHPDKVITLQMYLIVMIFFSQRSRVVLAQKGMIVEFEM